MQPFQQLFLFLSRYCLRSSGLIRLSRSMPDIRTASSRKVLGGSKSKGIPVSFDTINFRDELVLISVQRDNLATVEQTYG